MKAMWKRIVNFGSSKLKTGKVKTIGNSSVANSGTICGNINIGFTDEDIAQIIDEVDKEIHNKIGDLYTSIKDELKEVVELKIGNLLVDIQNNIQNIKDKSASVEGLGEVITGNYKKIKNNIAGVAEELVKELKCGSEATNANIEAIKANIDDVYNKLLYQICNGRKEFIEIKKAIEKLDKSSEKTLGEIIALRRLIEEELRPQMDRVESFAKKASGIGDKIINLFKDEFKDKIMPLLSSVAESIAKQDNGEDIKLTICLKQIIQNEVGRMVDILSSDIKDKDAELKGQLQEFKTCIENALTGEKENTLQILDGISALQTSLSQIEKVIKEGLAQSGKENHSSDDGRQSIRDEIDKLKIDKLKEIILSINFAKSEDLKDVVNIAKEILYNISNLANSSESMDHKLSSIKQYINDIINKPNDDVAQMSGCLQAQGKTLQQILKELQKYSPIRLNEIDCEKCGAPGAMKFRCGFCENTIVGGEMVNEPEVGNSLYTLKRNGLLIVYADENGLVSFEDIKNRIGDADCVRKILIKPNARQRCNATQIITIQKESECNRNNYGDIRTVFPKLERFGLTKYDGGYRLGKRLFSQSCVSSNGVDAIEFYGMQHVKEINAGCFYGINATEQIRDFIERNKMQSSFENSENGQIWGKSKC